MPKYFTFFALGHLMLVAGAAGAQTLTFAPIATYPSSGGMLAGIAVADLNADGRPDVLTTDQNTGQVGVLLGNGNGTFQAVKTYTTGGGGVRTVVVADVSGDGRPDALVGNSNTGTVGVLLGKGDGTLQTAVTYSAGSNSVPVDLALADVNGDGRLDVLTANYYTAASVSILLGNGNGTFQGARSYGAGASNSYPYGIAAADINGDGKLDLLTANAGSNTAGVLLGNGDGTFQTARNYATGTTSFTTSIKVADVNSDSRPDLLTANNTGGIAVQLGSGNGNFQTASVYSSGPNSSPNRLVAADLDGDGNLDIVAPSGGVSSSALGVLLGTSTGIFRAARTFFTGAGTIPNDVAVADVNADGRPDLLTIEYKYNTVGVLLNTTPLPTRAALPGATATLSPNPTEGGAATLTLAGLPATVARVQATLLDATGRAVAQQQLPATLGAARAEVPTGGLPAGLYVLRLAVLDAQGEAAGNLPAQHLSVR